MLDLRTLQRALGGEISAGQLLCPGPGHSAIDRSLSVKLDDSAPDGFLVHSFADDDPIMCKDYVREKIGLPAWQPDRQQQQPNRQQQTASETPAAKPNGSRRRASSDFIQRTIMAAAAGGDNEDKPRGRLVATFNYTNDDGALLYQVLKYDPKNFKQRRPDGNGGFIPNLDGVRRVLYRFPELLKYPDATVFVCEGEKDADRVASLGHCATTVAHGTWTDDCVKALAGRHIIILEDNDPAGRKKARKAAELLYGAAADVRIVSLPGLAEKEDVSDWLELSRLNTVDELLKISFNTPLWTPDTEADQAKDAADAEQAADTKEQTKSDARSHQATTSMERLKTMKFEPIKYVVPGIIVEGLTLIAGKPKIGKSWLLLHAAIAVARSGFTLGEIHCPEGDVLYCALEDNLRRLQSRGIKLLGHSQDWPRRLEFWCELPRLAVGGLDQIKAWIKAAAHPRLIIIDTLAMVRAPKKKDQTQYDADYAAVLELRKLASEYGIAIVLVHHLRKQDADDAYDAVSGTLGLTGAVDTVLVLKRESNGTIVLHGRGRDLIEVEKVMTFNKDACTWIIAGEASEVRVSTERKAVLDAMEEIGGPASPNEIAAGAQLKAPNVRRMLERMAREGANQRCERGKYSLPPAAKVGANNE